MVDTNVLSERMKKAPNQKVLSWLKDNRSEIYTCTHVIAELSAGIDSMEEGARKHSMQQWLTDLLEIMEGRILSFNTTVAMVWGQQEAAFRAKGCPMSMPDSFIAATARRYNMTVVTRDTGDYERPGIKVYNPYTIPD